jgi:ribosomal protein S6
LKTYEALFIFSSQHKEAELDKVVDKAKDEIVRLGGDITGTRVLGKKTFARPMKKRDTGNYIRVGFFLDASKIDALLARYKLNEDVFRVQITVADPTKMVVDKVEDPVEAEA